jgi:hypothetical protein
VVQITDSGSKPVKVAATLATVGPVQGACRITTQAPAYATIRPASLSLTPGQTRSVKVRVSKSAPQGDLAVEFTSARSSTGNVRVRAGVASQLVVHARVKAHGHPCLSVSGTVPTAAASDGPNPGAIAAVALLFGLIAAATMWRIRRRRNVRKAQGVLVGRHRAPKETPADPSGGFLS